MEQKFKLTKEIKIYAGRAVYRIEALRDTPFCKKGEKGGWLACEANLSQDGDCWVGGDAYVYDFALVWGDALVTDNACIGGSSQVFERARVGGDAYVDGNAIICENARVYGHAYVRMSASVGGSSQICDKTLITDHAKIFGYAEISDDAKVGGNSTVGGSVRGRAIVSGKALVGEDAVIEDDAQIFGRARVGCNKPPLRLNVGGFAEIGGDAVVDTIEDFIVFKNWWSSGRYLTWTRSNKMWRVGCFYGEGDALVSKAYKKGDKCGREYERLVSYVESFLEEGH